MSDDDKDSFRFNSLLVASTLTTILIAGSAYLWRAKMTLSISASDNVQDPDTVSPISSGQSKEALTLSGTNNCESEKAKNSRSKERRRRGKDPLRDILKNGKKLKAFSKLNLTSAEQDSVSNVKTTSLLSSLDSLQQESSANPSIASSRSPSSSRSRTRSSPEPSQQSDTNRDSPSEPSSHGPVPISIPSVLVVSSNDILPPPAKTGSREIETDLKAPHVLPSPAYSEHTRSFPNGDSPHSILRPPPNPHILDKHSPIQLPSISISTSSPAVVTNSTQDLLPAEQSEAPAIPPSFTSPIAINGWSPRRDIGNGLHNLRYAPTPRRTPTPSSRANSPPPSLTTQTQIASLRGALEAARQREAQMKMELERHAKEMESMYWERANWKRKEFELQCQVQYLAHQLQSFAVSVSQMNLNVSSAIPSTTASSRNCSSSPHTSPSNNARQVPLPSENPSPLHIVPPTPQVQSPPAMFSPLSPMHSVPLYHTYPQSHQQQSHAFSHFSSQLSPQVHSFPLSPSQRVANHASLMAAFSPHPVLSPSPGPLTSSTTPSSSSVGSMSPPEGTNFSVMPTIDRGRRKTRTNERVGDWLDAGGDDGVFFQRNDDGSDYGEAEVSETLADAILKRPGSLGWGKKSRSTNRSSPDSDIAQTEFTFPSLSDFGNVKLSKRARMESENQEDIGIDGRVASALGEADTSHYAQENAGTGAQNCVSERSHVGVSDLPGG